MLRLNVTRSQSGECERGTRGRDQPYRTKPVDPAAVLTDCSWDVEEAGK